MEKSRGGQASQNLALDCTKHCGLRLQQRNSEAGTRAADYRRKMLRPPATGTENLAMAGMRTQECLTLRPGPWPGPHMSCPVDGAGNEALEEREGEAQLCEAGRGELNSSCQETPGMAITFGRGGKLRTHFTETSQLPAPGPRRAGDCGLWVCPGRVAEQVGPASPSCGHPAWGAPAGRLEVEVARPSLPAHTSGPSFWGS